MFNTKENFLSLLVDTGQSLVNCMDEKPLSLKVVSAIALLHYAISSKDIKSVENLMELGIPANAKFKHQKSPLHLAVENCQAHIIDILAFYGADIYEKIEPGVSFLHCAVKKEAADVADALICAGLDVNMIDCNGISLFYQAAENGDLDTAAVFYDYDVDLFCDNLPLIHLAVKRNSLKAVKCFANLGMEIDVLDNDNDSPLFKAAKNGNLTMVKWLVMFGANLYLRDNEGYSYLHRAVCQNNITSAKTLLSAGMDVNVTGGWWNFTPLHLSASLGRLKIAKLLIEFNADTNAMTSDGKTAYIIANHNGLEDFNILLSTTSQCCEK